ncbi:lytic murein transglycosylase [Gordonia sp. (in: high G+C Gram-positive bacteria)]|uniref:lytic murein transglycosylase n=1 Tax=Gordonia sp. (in: high G+C Gram-positive bacteria) TaxID=84139 RepID=UPI0039E3610E
MIVLSPNRYLAVLAGVLASAMVVAGCSSRIEKGENKAHDIPSTQLKQWSELHAGPYEIPERALRSYAYAAAAMGKAQPGCGLGWSTLAAIGDISSDHGSASSGIITGEGIVVPALRNLTQANPAHAKPAADTDAGKYDGNETIDVTMGPMQILPSRWEQFATDADNDGRADPDNYDDATLTAARFLCAAGGNLRNGEGWANAVSQFNRTPGFVEKVHAKAMTYGR